MSLLLAGCTNDVAGSPIGTGQIVDSNPTATAPPGSGGADPGPPPTPSIPNFPKARDGSDIAACYDGHCEVELRAPVEIPMDPATGVTAWTLHRVDNVDGAYLTAVTSDGNGTLSAELYAEPGSDGGTVVLNGFTIGALATANGIAVLRFDAP